MKKVFFGLLLIISMEAYSQRVVGSTLQFYNNQTEDQFRTERSNYRAFNLSEGNLEMTDEPNYVWQDIVRLLRNHYGNRPPRVGDVFLYAGSFNNLQNWYILFRITKVDGMRVSEWNASRWRG